jgi:hypothetical protein
LIVIGRLASMLGQFLAKGSGMFKSFEFDARKAAVPVCVKALERLT